jgi:hypothetical protein
MTTTSDASDIAIESGVGAMSGLGYVRLHWGTMDGQLTTREARAHALSILDAAAAADHDAAVWRWLRGKLAMSEYAAASGLKDLRDARRAVDIDSGNLGGGA